MLKGCPIVTFLKQLIDLLIQKQILVIQKSYIKIYNDYFNIFICFELSDWIKSYYNFYMVEILVLKF